MPLLDYVQIFNANIDAINETKIILSTNFDMRDLGKADFIHGIKITK